MSKYIIIGDIYFSLGPLIQDIWLNMNNSRHGQSYPKVKIYSAVSWK
jgi:hypothetical protein